MRTTSGTVVFVLPLETKMTTAVDSLVHAHPGTRILVEDLADYVLVRSLTHLGDEIDADLLYGCWNFPFEEGTETRSAPASWSATRS